MAKTFVTRFLNQFTTKFGNGRGKNCSQKFQCQGERRNTKEDVSDRVSFWLLLTVWLLETEAQLESHLTDKRLLQLLCVRSFWLHWWFWLSFFVPSLLFTRLFLNNTKEEWSNERKRRLFRQRCDDKLWSVLCVPFWWPLALLLSVWPCSGFWKFLEDELFL